jgi:hypothetical protein
MSFLSWLSRSSTRGLASVSGPPIAKYRFVFGRERCQIQAALDTRFDNNGLLVISYIAFLFRYFNICDSNQIEPVSEYLLANIGDGSDKLPNNFAAHSAGLHARVMATYDKAKQAAAERVFDGLPPAHQGYGSEAIPTDQTRYPNLLGSMEPYELAVTVRGVPLFDMGNGPHLVLLPQTVLLLYAFVVEHLTDPNMPRAHWGSTPKEWLDRLIRSQIASHSEWDPTTSATMAKGTRLLLKSLGFVGSSGMSVSDTGEISFPSPT